MLAALVLFSPSRSIRDSWGRFRRGVQVGGGTSVSSCTSGQAPVLEIYRIEPKSGEEHSAVPCFPPGKKHRARRAPTGIPRPRSPSFPLVLECGRD